MEKSAHVFAFLSYFIKLYLNYGSPKFIIYRGYYTEARRYEFYFRVVKTIFYHEKIKFISSSRRVIFFLLYRQECFCTNNSVKAGNDVIVILTGEDMENTPLESRM